jgi:hypothetical protein
MVASASVAFNPPPFDSLADIRKFVVLRDDFVGGRSGDDTAERIGELTVQGHPGVISLNTGPTSPTAADEASLSLSNVDALILEDATMEHLYLAAVVRFPSVADVEFNFGIFDALNAAGRGVNSVSVEFDKSADDGFQLVVVDGSAADVTDMVTEPAANTWYTIEIAAHEDEVQARVSTAGAVGTLYVNTDVDIPDDEGLAPMFKVATETSAEKSVLIDAFMLRAKVNR